MYHWKGSKKWKGLLKYPPTIWILNCRFVVLFFVVSVVLWYSRALGKGGFGVSTNNWFEVGWAHSFQLISIFLLYYFVVLWTLCYSRIRSETLFQCAQRLAKRQQLSTQEYWKLQYCTTYMIVIYYEYLFNDKHNIIIIKNNTAFLISIDYRVLITGLYIV